MSEQTTFIKALMGEFPRGDMPSQEYMTELKRLTNEDKRDLYHGLKSKGIDCSAPTGANGPIDVSSNPRGY